ncbi:MAG: hypothetical protein MSL26_07170 [Clostridiales bacterium]|nr:hypothetical protein [Clostridiales bacterium]
MILNTHPENRKEMVKAICELTGMNATYLFTPTYAYQVGPITVSRDGSIVCEDEAMLSTIKPMLIERGWLEAEARSEMPVETESPADSKEVPDTMETIGVEQMDITMPIPGWTVAQMTNLLRMLCCKQNLINRMIGCDMLSIEESFVQAMSENPPESTADLEARVQEAIEAGSICGFRFSDGQITLGTPFAQDEPTRWTAYADLFKGMLRIAETATRISLKRLDDPENEKYHANSWLMRMGLRGPQNKETRRILMGHLTGFAAFRSAADMQAHKERMARKRREVRQNEQSKA